MILLSNIIKSKYVFYDTKKQYETQHKKIHQSGTLNAREDLYEIYNQREAIIKQANDEATKIVNTARRNVQAEIVENKKKAFEEGYNSGLEVGTNKGIEEGTKKGYEDGYNKIREELNEQYEGKILELTNMIKAVEKEKDSIIEKYEKDIVQLSLDIAEKIMRQKLDIKDNVMSHIVRDIVKDYKNVDWIKIYLSDKDNVHEVETDKVLINELQKVSKDVKIEVLNDADEGSCVVETPNCIIDAGVKTQLNNLKDIVLNK